MSATRLQSEIIRQTMQGYQQTETVLEQERITRLAHLTVSEARRQFQELVASWEAVANREADVKRLDSWRLETLLARRNAFQRLAEARGLV